MQIKINYEVQFLINPTLNDEIKEELVKKGHNKLPKSIDQTYNSSYESEITSLNIN